MFNKSWAISTYFLQRESAQSNALLAQLWSIPIVAMAWGGWGGWGVAPLDELIIAHDGGVVKPSLSRGSIRKGNLVTPHGP